MSHPFIVILSKFSPSRSHIDKRLILFTVFTSTDTLYEHSLYTPVLSKREKVRIPYTQSTDKSNQIYVRLRSNIVVALVPPKKRTQQQNNNTNIVKRVYGWMNADRRRIREKYLKEK